MRNNANTRLIVDVQQEASSGSVRDGDTIEMCERYGISLLMQPDTEVRGFAAH